ncbi:hypothetical protein LMG23992_00288 [Cupriavidus laharis]|uniref:DUF4148 domain-containing protein n=1 Tax=Cupriavidus laharis TaxID=151654 RepID=A0ABM8WCW4_9BURK|nr:hypothetical protein [Cupriavidus laharis]CAG9165140.1 hypothetical protein LMG23992_00288 [Cupriavidus laharis]
MFTRSLLRDLAAGILAAAGLIGAVAASHAQVTFWPRLNAEARAPRVQAAGGWQMASVRAESRDHVQAQIDRMEARARADDRLSGRPNAPQGREDNRSRQPERTSQNETNRNDTRPVSIGPGWQARGRDGSR